MAKKENQNIFDEKNPDKKLDNLNALSGDYMLAYIEYKLKNAGDDTKIKEKVAAFYHETKGKGLKEKRRAFANAFMPELIETKKSFEERLFDLIKE